MTQSSHEASVERGLAALAMFPPNMQQDIMNAFSVGGSNTFALVREVEKTHPMAKPFAMMIPEVTSNPDGMKVFLACSYIAAWAVSEGVKGGDEYEAVMTSMLKVPPEMAAAYRNKIDTEDPLPTTDESGQPLAWYSKMGNSIASGARKVLNLGGSLFGWEIDQDQSNDVDNLWEKKIFGDVIYEIISRGRLMQAQITLKAAGGPALATGDIEDGDVILPSETGNIAALLQLAMPYIQHAMVNKEVGDLANRHRKAALRALQSHPAGRKAMALVERRAPAGVSMLMSPKERLRQEIIAREQAADMEVGDIAFRYGNDVALLLETKQLNALLRLIQKEAKSITPEEADLLSGETGDLSNLEGGIRDARLAMARRRVINVKRRAGKKITKRDKIARGRALREQAQMIRTSASKYDGQAGPIDEWTTESARDHSIYADEMNQRSRNHDEDFMKAEQQFFDDGTEDEEDM